MPFCEGSSELIGQCLFLDRGPERALEALSTRRWSCRTREGETKLAKGESFSGVKLDMTDSSGSFQKASQIPMRVLTKEPLIVAALIVAASVAIAVVGIIYKTKDSIQNDRIELMADANAKQVAPLRRVVQGRLQQDRTRLIQFATTRSTLGPGRARAFGDFALVAMVVPSSGGQWTVQWTEKGPMYPRLQAGKNVLTYEQEIALLRSLPYDRIREGDVHWQRLSDTSGRPIWMMAVAVETLVAPAGTTPANSSLPEGIDYQSVQIGTGGKAVVVGFFGRNPLLAATEDFIGSTSTAFVIDSRGYAASHSNKAMVGALLREDPSVKEVFSARSSAGATRYNSTQGTTVFSAFEQVDRANLYVVMATPDVVTMVSSRGFAQTALMAGLLAIIVGFALIIAWSGRLVPRIPISAAGLANKVDLNPSNSQLLEKQAGLVEDEKISWNVTLSKAKSEYVQKMVDGLERSMREPLLAALAHVQLLKSKSADSPSSDLMREMADHVASVDRDLRRAKDLIDSLGNLASTRALQLNDDPLNLKSAIDDFISKERSRFEAEGIAIDVQMDSVPLVSGRADVIKSALLEIFENARRALLGRNGKNLKVSLEDKIDSVVLSISDNGIGMTRDIQAQAFEPFIKEFDLPQAKGLGLSFVKTAIESSGGSVELISSPGQGTIVRMHWPVKLGERNDFEKLVVTQNPPKREFDTAEAGTSSGLAPLSFEGKGVDFTNEGRITLGGKSPLSDKDFVNLPPAPSLVEDDEDDRWSFDRKPNLGAEESQLGTVGMITYHEPDEIVVRPVRRD
jgi:signal transduction histidine kinase